MDLHQEQTRGGWYTVVYFSGGVADCPPIPRGPWWGQDAAEAALAEWRRTAGELAGTHAAKIQARLVGPYSSIQRAREADVTSRRVVRPL